MNSHAEKIASHITATIHDLERFPPEILQDGVAMALSEVFDDYEYRIAELEGDVQQLQEKVRDLASGL